MSEFCVVCGRTGVPLEEGVCTDCFVKSHALVSVKAHPKVVICPECGARKTGESWEGAGSPALLSKEDLLPFLLPLDGVAIRRVEFEEGGTSRLLRELSGTIAVRFRGEERQVRVKFEVRIEHHTCPACSRRSGGFYTSVIQLRGPEGRRRGNSRDLREGLRRAWDAVLPEARAEWRSALSWFEPLKEGWDFYLTDTDAAKSLARWMRLRLGAKLSESPSLWGRKDGREVYRVTFCLRLPASRLEPEVRPGLVVAPEPSET
ncbi:MAG: 60S ribosomal export protein NMD3 [Thermoplasmata archaeon]|nr:60S ribosomal export protein NMD3 [Thermoplasmata archaeon]